ncbi:MAG: hypothetical protein ACKV2O_24410 [Acidimicrobiales bacterium]
MRSGDGRTPTPGTHRSSSPQARDGSASPLTTAGGAPTTTPSVSTAPAKAAAPATSAPPTTPPETAPPVGTPVATVGNLYAETTIGKLSPAVRDVPTRVYVPNSDGQTLSIIDPATGTLLVTLPVGVLPHHIVPSWDLTTLYVLDTAGNTLVPIDPRTAALGTPIPVEDPYNLYFTPDGSTALVIAERFKRIDARDPRTWQLRWSVSVPHSGVNHGDFSLDGRFFYATCEFSGWVVKIDLLEQRIVAERKAGAQPIDLRLAPDASKLYVADQGRGGVMMLHPTDLHELGFIPTGAGTHGLYFSRDVTRLYATNRGAGTVSVIDLATNTVAATWTVPRGGSPDMGSVSADGNLFWVSGRHHGEVYAFDTTSGALVHRIKTGPGAHGLTLFPQPGRFSMGHTGNYR